jgi:hypothetical protein
MKRKSKSKESKALTVQEAPDDVSSTTQSLIAASTKADARSLKSINEMLSQVSATIDRMDVESTAIQHRPKGMKLKHVGKLIDLQLARNELLQVRHYLEELRSSYVEDDTDEPMDTKVKLN